MDKMTNRYGREVDKTYLSIDNAEERGFLHRDYIAHCLRWTHFVKCIAKRQAYKDARVLDIGCGKEAPLARLLYSSRMFPRLYVGIDMGNINEITLGRYRGNATFRSHADAADVASFGPNFDFIVCYEVLEHVEPLHAVKILKRIKNCLASDGTAFISTPNWNGKAAGNHVNEMRYKVIGRLLEMLGFNVDHRFGTFASQSEIEPQLQPASLEWGVYKELKNYYDSNFLACVFAPMFPDYSRNVLWRVTHQADDYEPWFPMPDKEPFSSSEKWEDLRDVLKGS